MGMCSNVANTTVKVVVSIMSYLQGFEYLVLQKMQLPKEDCVSITSKGKKK